MRYLKLTQLVTERRVRLATQHNDIQHHNTNTTLSIDETLRKDTKCSVAFITLSVVMLNVGIDKVPYTAH